MKIKNETRLGFVYSYKTRDITKNYAPDEALSRIERYLREGFNAATLFTTENDFVFDGQKNAVRENPPTYKVAPDESHDRKKPARSLDRANRGSTRSASRMKRGMSAKTQPTNFARSTAISKSSNPI